MQDFSSISVSSYEAGTLAERLGEQSRDGWSVVAIVPTGSTVTAYLSREADTATTTDDAESTAAAAGTVVADDQSDIVETAEGTGSEAPAEESAADPVSEAPGWAAGAAAAAVEPSTTPSADAADADAEPAATETAATPEETAPEATATAAAGAAPAGWYADPSSRFELRYWDGTQWTEHVSRAGQQYTDPPVA